LCPSTTLYSQCASIDYKDLPLSLGAVVSDKGLHGDSLPDWLEQGTESSLRDSEDDKPAAPTQPVFVKTSSWLSTPVASTPIEGLSPKTTAARNGGSIGPYTDLDRFYAESDDAEDDADSEEDGSEAASDKQHGRRSNDESEGEDDGDESEEESEGA
jgi:AP-3 complex subunit beta